MRVLVLALCTLSAGCVASSDDSSSRREPVSYAKPAGDGWACFRDRNVTDVSTCDRPALCDKRRAAYATEMDRRGAAYDLTPCIGRPGVACFTYRSTVAADVFYLCSELMSECEGTAEYARTQTKDWRDVSDCGAW